MKRFFFVKRTDNGVAHRHYGALVEGEKMACGRRLSKGYHWFTRGVRQNRLCKQCMVAGGNR